MAVKESSSEEAIKSESSKESEAIEDETVEETFEVVVESVPVVEEGEESLPVVVTAEELMTDYPQWTLESGQTPADYNTKRKDEANKRLRDNGLSADDEFINRNPIRITREDEKMIRKNVGHMDYTPLEANVVIYGLILFLSVIISHQPDTEKRADKCYNHEIVYKVV